MKWYWTILVRAAGTKRRQQQQRMTKCVLIRRLCNKQHWPKWLVLEIYYFTTKQRTRTRSHVFWNILRNILMCYVPNRTRPQHYTRFPLGLYIPGDTGRGTFTFIHQPDVIHFNTLTSDNVHHFCRPIFKCISLNNQHVMFSSARGLSFVTEHSCIGQNTNQNTINKIIAYVAFWRSV